MKIAIHLTEKITYKWPLEYWIELIHKLTKKGHEVYALSDEPYVRIDDKNPLLFDRLHLSDELSRVVIAQSDMFIGPPLKYYAMAINEGKRVVALLGPTLNGEGVKSSAQCAGCRDKMDNVNDCLWEDELCQFEMTPNDVLTYMQANA